MNFKKHLLLAGNVAVILMGCVEFARADLDFAAVAAGVSYSNPQGNNFQNYSPATGGVVDVWMSAASILGSDFQFHGAVEYLPFKINGLTDYSISQWSFLLGVETRSAAAHWLKPFFSMDVGAVYSSLSLPSTVSNPTQNFNVLLAAQARPGISIPVFGKLEILMASPIKIIFSTNQFVTLNGEFSLRWGL